MYNAHKNVDVHYTQQNTVFPYLCSSNIAFIPLNHNSLSLFLFYPFGNKQLWGKDPDLSSLPLVSNTVSNTL